MISCLDIPFPLEVLFYIDFKIRKTSFCIKEENSIRPTSAKIKEYLEGSSAQKYIKIVSSLLQRHRLCSITTRLPMQRSVSPHTGRLEMFDFESPCFQSCAIGKEAQYSSDSEILSKSTELFSRLWWWRRGIRLGWWYWRMRLFSKYWLNYNLKLQPATADVAGCNFI